MSSWGAATVAMTRQLNVIRVRPQDAVFKNLVESAFEFLERAISEIDDAPKFSTIHFAIAVELFLKARLMREHWSLIVDHPDKSSHRHFIEGRAHTVNPGQAIRRLKEIAEVAISPTAQQAFDAVFDRRNQMIHFVHGVVEPGKKAALLEAIALEQCRGWLHLEQLLADWTDHLAWVNARIANVRRDMKRHNRFLKVRFEALAAEIAAEKAQGTIFRKCRACTFRAARQVRLTNHVAKLECRVCDVRDMAFTIPCSNPSCGKPVRFTSYAGLPQECSKCQTAFAASDVSEALDTEPVTTDNYVDVISINCASCMGYHSVVQHETIYVCTECLDVQDDYGVCGFCAEGQMGGGDLAYSYQTGCEFCDGAAGWSRDD